MPVTRSYSNAFEVVDYTQELNVVSNQWSLLNEVGLFQEESLSTFTVTFEEINKTLGLISDQVRGYKPQANQDYSRKIRSYNVPYFPITDQVLPQDVMGKRAYGSNNVETKDAVIARKIERMQASMDATKEIARWATLANGDVYSPAGVVVSNMYTDFGVSRKSVGFALGVGTTDVLSKIEEVIAHQQDNAFTGDVITGVIGYCSPQFFAALVSHPKVTAAFQYYSSTQEPLRQRVGGSGLNRRFQYGGIEFIEVRNQVAGTKFVADNTAIFVPQGTRDTFMSYYAPANRFGYENTLAEKGYVWVFNDPKGEKIEIEGEFSMINVLRRPQLVVTGTVT